MSNIFIYAFLLSFSFIGLVGRVLTIGPGDLSSIPGCVIPKTLKMVLDTSLFNPQQYKVRIKSKVEHPPLHLGVVAIEKGAFWLPSTTVDNFTLLFTLKLKYLHLEAYKVGDLSRGWPKGFFFNSYYTEV